MGFAKKILVMQMHLFSGDVLSAPCVFETFLRSIPYCPIITAYFIFGYHLALFPEHSALF